MEKTISKHKKYLLISWVTGRRQPTMADPPFGAFGGEVTTSGCKKLAYYEI
jgi:hypothetical protein